MVIEGLLLGLLAMGIAFDWHVKTKAIEEQNKKLLEAKKTTKEIKEKIINTEEIKTNEQKSQQVPEKDFEKMIKNIKSKL